MVISIELIEDYHKGLMISYHIERGLSLKSKSLVVWLYCLLNLNCILKWGPNLNSGLHIPTKKYPAAPTGSVYWIRLGCSGNLK